MTTHRHDHDQWSDCPRDLIARTSRRHAAHLRREHLRRMTVAAVLLLAVPAAAWTVGTFRARRAIGHERLTCREVKELSRDYLAGMLDAEVRVRFDQHLHRCGKCRDWLYRQAPGHRVSSAAPRHPPQAAAVSPPLPPSPALGLVLRSSPDVQYSSPAYVTWSSSGIPERTERW